MRQLLNTITYLSRDNKSHRLMWISIYTLLFLLLVGIVYVFLIIYTSTLAGNVDNYKHYIDYSNRQIEFFDFYSKNRNHVRDAYARISSKFSQPELVHELQSVADKADIYLVSQNYRDEEYSDTLIRHVIRLTVNGNYSSLKKYLNELTNVRGVAVIDRVVMTRGNGSGAITTDIQLSVFSMRGHA